MVKERLCVVSREIVVKIIAAVVFLFVKIGVFVYGSAEIGIDIFGRVAFVYALRIADLVLHLLVQHIVIPFKEEGKQVD